MTFSNCCPFVRSNNNNEKKTPIPSWRELLSNHGPELWSIRRRAFFGEEKHIVALSIMQRSHKSWWRRIVDSDEKMIVISCPHLFCQVEKEQDDMGNLPGLDKPDTTGIPPRPLNRCIGDEWKRQRSQLQGAFTNLPQRSLEAARKVPFRDILEKHTIRGQDPAQQSNKMVVVDWKQVSLDLSLLWVVQLFRGYSDPRLEETCMAVWEVSRSHEPVPGHIFSQKQQDFLECLGHPDRGTGVLQSIFQSGLSESEARDNALNAMVAAMDGAQALLFWTLWNLSNTNKYKGGWTECRKLLDRDADDLLQMMQNDLEGLARFKKAAVQGEIVDYSPLSYLARALCETVRVFPPVWTLPRTWPQKTQFVSMDDPTFGRRPICWSKLDIPSVNGANRCWDWDPNNPPTSTRIASFGIGRRHCPAGTAALHAVYYFLIQSIQKMEHIEECNSNHALHSVYLLPTLGVVGPQYFHVLYCQDQEDEETSFSPLI